SGLDGVKNNLEAPSSVDQDIFAMTQAEKDAAGIESLPANLKEAVDALKANPLARETLGEHIFTKYVAGKEKEWDCYRTAVTDWEIENYIANY
ncbi:MAG: type I glutamate--ammonia ligase, partial [Desulfobulbaceae bacterium]|nr:type I glutamate--ammonia ligase [Desulfobulbaceae bacterium]